MSLDQHGTDIKFSRGMHAAVTLGPKLTKDRMVQGELIVFSRGKWLPRMQVVCGSVS